MTPYSDRGLPVITLAPLGCRVGFLAGWYNNRSIKLILPERDDIGVVVHVKNGLVLLGWDHETSPELLVGDGDFGAALRYINNMVLGFVWSITDNLPTICRFCAATGQQLRLWRHELTGIETDRSLPVYLRLGEPVLPNTITTLYALIDQRDHANEIVASPSCCCSTKTIAERMACHATRATSNGHSQQVAR